MKNKWEIGNNIFSYDAWFLGKSSLKICLVQFDVKKYQLDMSKQSTEDYHITGVNKSRAYNTVFSLKASFSRK